MRMKKTQVLPSENGFHPYGAFKNPHVQSVIASLRLRYPLVRFQARKMLKAACSHILDCGDGVRLQGYFSGHDPPASDLAILIHGWEGSSESAYLVSAGGYLWKQGFDLFRLNLRDHGPSHHLNPELFHACRLDEVIGAVRAIQKRFARKRTFLAGFSLGGNFALRVAAQAPAAGIHLERAVAVSPVLNPKRTLDALETGWPVYHGYFMKKWRESLRKKRACFPDLDGLDEIGRFDSLREMTDYFVRRHTDMGQIHAYLDGYAITGERLARLKVPSHIIASQDDPVIPWEDLERLAPNPALSIELLPHGGHCGFIEGIGLKSWAEKRLVGLFREQAPPIC